MRSDWTILNKLWQYSGGCTTREKSYTIRERELIRFPLCNFSDSAPQLHPFCCHKYPSSLLLFKVFDVKNSAFGVICNNNNKKVFLIITYPSAHSYHNFIHHSANGFTTSTRKWSSCVPAICHSSPLTMKSYTKFLGGVNAARSLSPHPSFPLQVCLVGS